jgi:hypothetical protein
MITTGDAQLSNRFKCLYCDPTLFDSFSTFHPISFRRALPFQSRDPVVDDPHLLHAEEAHLADKSEESRRRLVDEYLRCGLLDATDAANLKTGLDFFDTDFFEMMGLAYANAGIFRCALRWYCEPIRELEDRKLNLRSDEESVYASIGYCLYSLGLFEEAISWSKSCIGPRAMADMLCQSLIAYEVEPAGGMIRLIERMASRTRYTVSAPGRTDVSDTDSRLKTAMAAFAPFQEIYVDWVSSETPSPVLQPDGYPFKAELDGGSLLRHKMNLIFATCCQADALIDKGYELEAKRLLCEAALVEPEAGIVWERLRALT